MNDNAVQIYRRIKILFLLLILAQGLHSIEEYFGKLWDVLLPARILSELFSKDLASGFLIFNISLFVFGLFCWFITTGNKKIKNMALIWFWIALETFNGIGHLFFAIRLTAYYPGLFTAMVLLILSILLAKELVSYNRHISKRS